MSDIVCQQDIMLAFQQLKLGKAAELDTISAEMLINADVILSQRLVDLSLHVVSMALCQIFFCDGRISYVPRNEPLGHESAD